MNECRELLIVSRRQPRDYRWSHFATVAVRAVASGTPAFKHFPARIVLAGDQSGERKQGKQGYRGDWMTHAGILLVNDACRDPGSGIRRSGKWPERFAFDFFQSAIRIQHSALSAMSH